MKLGLTYDRNRNLATSLSLACIGAFFVAVVSIIAVPQAAEYEISIYDSLPTFSLVIILTGLASGIISLLLAARSREDLGSERIALIGIALLNTIVILLPVIRGYHFYGRADPLTHLGETRFIMDTGHIGGENFYPFSHIIAAIASTLLQVDERFVMMVSPAVSYLVYLGGMYAWSEVISDSKAQRALIMAFSVPLMFTYFHSFFFPTQFAVSIVPLIMAVYERRRRAISSSTGEALILLILLIGLPFIHILGALLVGVVFLLRELSTILHRLLQSSGVTQPTSRGPNFTPFMILLIASFAWFSSFAVFNRSVTKFYDWFWLEIGTTPVDDIQSAIMQSGISESEFIELLLRLDGHHLIYIFITGFSIALLIWRSLRVGVPVSEQDLFLALSFIVLSMIFLASLLGDFTLTGANIRIFVWALVFSIPLNGRVLYQYLNETELGKGLRSSRRSKDWHDVILRSYLGLLLFLSAAIGLLNAHDSPAIQRANKQVTHRDIEGMTWLLGRTSPADSVSYLDELAFRSVNSIAGAGFGEESEGPPFLYAPRNFEFTPFLQEGEGSFVGRRYLAISGYNTAVYTQMWPEIGRVTEEDLLRIGLSPMYKKIYTNGEFEVWMLTDDP